MVGAVAFAIGQFACSNYISVELTDIVAALVSTAAIVTFLRFWQPSEPVIGEAPAGRFQRPAVAGSEVHDPRWSARSPAATTPRRTPRATWCGPTRPT